VISLYLHFPFCLQKCRYCAFNSIPLPLGEDGSSLVTRYLCSLRKELVFYASLCQGETLTSVYCGGGTPTLLPAESIAEVLAVCRRHFLCSEDLEITVEANPGTVSLESLAVLKRAGVNRISLGVQSFCQEELDLLGRAHSVADVYTAWEAARLVGFDNINLDLIYALPGQTIFDWRYNLCSALKLHSDHLSIYGLALEEGTPLFHDMAAGIYLPCREEDELAMWEETSSVTAAAGYVRYEISNYAQPGKECRHNISYWKNTPYLGLGAGAHGFFAGVRYANDADLYSYMAKVEQDQLPRAWEEDQTPEQERVDTVIMGLRLTAGLSRKEFQNRFGCPFEDFYGDQLLFLVQEGLMGVSEDFIYLTEQGRLLANYVLAHFV
jgi:oxygen-independent coproporphyrinogen-3 oxidase